MANARPKILIACNEQVRNGYLPPEQLARLERFADWRWFACQGGGIYRVDEDAQVRDRLKESLDQVDGLVICHGSPRIDAEIDRMGGILTGKRVGLIGGGHMGRRLIKLLRPFEVEIWVYDPYLPRELAEALDLLQEQTGKTISPSTLTRLAKAPAPGPAT